MSAQPSSSKPRGLSITLDNNRSTCSLAANNVRSLSLAHSKDLVINSRTRCRHWPISPTYLLPRVLSPGGLKRREITTRSQPSWRRLHPFRSPTKLSLPACPFQTINIISVALGARTQQSVAICALAIESMKWRGQLPTWSRDSATTAQLQRRARIVNSARRHRGRWNNRNSEV